MLLLILSVLCLLTVAVFIFRLLRLAKQRIHIPDSTQDRSDWPKVSIIIPARNEAENITGSLGSVLEQDYPTDKLEIIVIDDFSEDATKDIAESLMAKSEFSAQCIQGRALPKGWLGKSNACMWGATHASGDYLFFIDADTHSSPHMLKSVIDFTQTRDIEMLSFNPQQVMVSKGEKSLLPGIFLSTANSMNFVASNDPTQQEAIANGQAMLFKAESYRAVNGHELVKSDVSEDLAFAKKMKQRGFRIFWAFADSLMRTRMYTSAKDIWQGFSKNMNRIVKAETLPLATWYWVKCQWIAWMSPILLVVSFLQYQESASQISTLALGINLITSIVLLGTFSGLVRELSVPIRHAIFVPFGISMNGFLAINAWRLQKLNRVVWKNRSLPQ
ncbi:glycosyltransferase family 2 protein [Vibrio breoganii]